MSENKKGNTVLLTVIAVATLLVAVVGATFAYFTASVSGNDNASSVIVRTAQIGTITYTAGQELRLENAYPGAESNTITFTIAADANATVDVGYTINWVDVVSTFRADSLINGVAGDPTDLVYTLTGSGNTNGGTLVTVAANTQAPIDNGIIGSGVLKPGETHSYTLTVKFLETGDDQNDNQGRSFDAKINVTTGDASGSTIYYNNANQNGTTTRPTVPGA